MPHADRCSCLLLVSVSSKVCSLLGERPVLNPKIERVVKCALAPGLGSSGSTCSGMLAFLASCKHPPAFFLIENVKELLDGPENIVWLGSRMRERGYAMVYDVLKTVDFGLPQTRSRFFALCLHAQALRRTIEELEDLGSRAFALQRSLRVSPLPLDLFLLADDHPYLQTELARRTSAQQSNESEAWKKLHTAAMLRLDQPFSKIYPEERYRKSPWPLKDREVQVLGYGLLTSGDKDYRCFDVSQTLGRAFTAEQRLVPSICPRSKLWLIDGGRAASGATRANPRRGHPAASTPKHFPIILDSEILTAVRWQLAIPRTQPRTAITK